MSADVPRFRELSLEQIPIKDIVEVNKIARQRYAQHFANVPGVYAERLTRRKIERLLVVMPVIVVPIRNTEDPALYHVIAGLRTWAAIQCHPSLRKIPCLVMHRRSPLFNDLIDRTELITCQGLMRNEANDADWLFAHDAILGEEGSDDSGSPRLSTQELAKVLRKTTQCLRDWRDRRDARNTAKRTEDD